MAKDQSVLIKIITSYTDKGVKEAGQDLDALERGVASLAKVASGAIVGVGVAAGKLAKDSIAAFAGFDKQLREVFTLLPGLTDKAMSAMKDDVLTFMRETGRAASEVVPALYQSISAGVPQENVFEFLAAANEAALGGVTDLETAVDGLTSVVNAYGRDVIDVQTASDLLFQAVRGGKTTFSELSESMFQALPTFAASGVAFHDLTAAVATLTAQGVPTNVAMTQLRSAVAELGQEGSKAAEIFEAAAGQSFREFIAAGGDLQGALAIMQRAADESGVSISDLFSRIEAANAALVLTGSGAEKFTAELEAAQSAMGATGAAADTMSGSLQLTFDKASASLDELKIRLGEQLAPALVPAIQAFTAAVDQLLAKLASEEGQRFFADLETGAKGFFGTYRNETQAMIAGRLQEAQSAEEYIALLRDIQAISEELAYLDAFTLGANLNIEQNATQQIREELIATAGSMEDYLALVEEMNAQGIRLYEGPTFGDPTTAIMRAEAEYARFQETLQAQSAASADAAMLTSAAYRQLARDAGDVGDSSATAGDGLDVSTAAAERTARALAQLNGVSAENTSWAEEEYWASRHVAQASRDRARAYHEAREAAEAAIAKEVALFQELGTAISQARNPVADLISATADLGAAQGDWVQVYRDHGREIEDINRQLASDLTDEQEGAMREILRTTAEGSADWLAAWDALEGDLSDSARQAMVAQRAALEGDAGMSSVFTGDAEAAEEARQRIEAANAAISASYRQTVLDIVEARMAEAIAQGGQEALNAQLQMIELQAQLGAISRPEADKLAEVATNTYRVTEATNQLMDLYMRDGSLSAQEMANIANAVALVEENTNLSIDSIVRLAERGVGSMDELTAGAEGLSGTLTTMSETEYNLDFNYTDVEETQTAVEEVETLVGDLTAEEWVLLIEGGADGALSDIEQVESEINALTSGTYSVHIGVTADPLPQIGGGPQEANEYAEYRSAGGLITGGVPGQDSVLSWLMPGEIVVPVSATASLDEAMRFVSRFVPGGVGSAGGYEGGDSYGRNMAPAGGDQIYIQTSDDVGKLLRSIQASQAQKRQARGFS